MKLFISLCIFLSFGCIYGEEGLFQYASQYNDKELLETLLKYGTDPSYPALNKALKVNDINSAIILIYYNTDINKRDPQSTIRIHGNRGWFADVKVDGESALEMAITQNMPSLTALLLEKGANPYSFRYTINKTNNFVQNITAMSLSIDKNDTTNIKIFIENGIDLNKICFSTHQYSSTNKKEYTPLQYTIAFHPEMTDLLNYFISNDAHLECK